MDVNITLHLVRSGHDAIGVVSDDWIVSLPERTLCEHGNPPINVGSLSHGQLVQLITRAARVIVW